MSDPIHPEIERMTVKISELIGDLIRYLRAKDTDFVADLYQCAQESERSNNSLVRLASDITRATAEIELNDRRAAETQSGGAE